MIFNKMFSRFIVMLLTSFAVLGIFLFTLLGNYVTNEKQSGMISAADRLSKFSSELAIRNNDEYYDIYETSIELIGNNLNCEIYLADVNGRVIAKTINKFTKFNIVSMPPEDADTINSGKMVKALGTRKGYDEIVLTIAMPVKYMERVIGGVYLITNVPELAKLRMDVIKMYLFSVLFALLVSFVITYIFAKRITEPIHAISKASKLLSSGNFSARVKVYKEDEIGHLAMEFNKMADSLSKVEDMRRSFISDVSHELRTPMTTITGFIQGVLDDTIPEDKKDMYLKIVLDESKRLSKLVSDLLDISRLESDEVKLEISKFDINELIRLTVIGFERRLNEKYLTVNVIFENEVEYVSAEKDSIKRVLTNLIDNGIKFCCERGTIEIKTKVKDGKVIVSVKNDGEGISEEEQGTIFERFYKLDKSRSKNKTGVGLGLYIVKSIIAKHREKIWIDSVVGEYAEFSFSLKRFVNKSK